MTIAHDPDDVPEIDIDEVEHYLASRSRTAPVGRVTSGEATGDPLISRSGTTRRVRRLAHRVAEAREVVALQDADELATAHSSRVLRTRIRSAEATQLVRLRQHPAFTALATVRARRVVTATGFIALTIALGWSTAGVQQFAAGAAPSFSPAWWFAWGVEPIVSFALLTIVIARAFLASRGQTISDPAVRRAEWVFLAATLAMNTWRYLPGVASQFRVDQLVVHMLGPIVAVCVVTVLPALWVAIDQVPSRTASALPTEDGGSEDGGSEDGGSAEPTTLAERTAPRADERVAAAVARTRELIQDGRLPPTPSARAVHRALGGAMDTARAVRDILRRGP